MGQPEAEDAGGDDVHYILAARYESVDREGRGAYLKAVPLVDGVGGGTLSSGRLSRPSARVIEAGSLSRR